MAFWSWWVAVFFPNHERLRLQKFEGETTVFMKHYLESCVMFEVPRYVRVYHR